MLFQREPHALDAKLMLHDMIPDTIEVNIVNFHMMSLCLGVALLAKHLDLAHILATLSKLVNVNGHKLAHVNSAAASLLNPVFLLGVLPLRRLNQKQVNQSRSLVSLGPP